MMARRRLGLRDRTPLVHGPANRKPVRRTALIVTRPDEVETATIDGVVTDGDTGDPVDGATVEAAQDGSVVGSSTTNIDGEYSLYGLELGTYDLTASHADYISETRTVDFTEYRSEDFALAPSVDYASEVLSDSPVAYWRLGEASGSTTAVDETGNGHDGTYQGPTLEAAGVTNDGDTAASFDASDDYVDMGSPAALNITGDLTLEAWIKTPSRSERQTVMTWANGNQTDFPYHLTILENGVLRLGRSGTSVDFTAIDDGSWHHIVITDDRTNDEATLYVDGALDTQKAYSPSPGSGDDILALSRKSTDFFGDVMDEPAVYDKVVSATRVQAHYDAVQ